MVKDSDNNEQFPGLSGEEVLPAASTDLRLDYAFYKLGKTVEIWMADHKLGCPGIRTWEEGTETEVSSRARRVILAGETFWYSLKCRQTEVQLATDWDTHTCFKELPVWVNADKPHRSLRFLVPGSRLLLNVSLPDSCIMNNRLPPGYQTTLGEWVALTPQLRLLTSPLKETGDFTEPESAGPMIRRDLIQMIRRHEGILHRWAEYYQRQFR